MNHHGVYAIKRILQIRLRYEMKRVDLLDLSDGFLHCVVPLNGNRFKTNVVRLGFRRRSNPCQVAPGDRRARGMDRD